MTMLTDCWLFDGALTTAGYGSARHEGVTGYTHRLVYEALVGEITTGNHIDHLCRVRHCYNPLHLEDVTPAENQRRAAAARTHCRHGHPLDGLRGNGYRYCLICNRERARVRR